MEAMALLPFGTQVGGNEIFVSHRDAFKQTSLHTRCLSQIRDRFDMIRRLNGHEDDPECNFVPPEHL
jgi:hypothetical protein